MDILKNIWYMARRFKTATALNFIGLTVAFAAFYLLMTQVEFNRNYNHCFPDGERIYRVEAKWNVETAKWGINCCRPFLKKISEMPQVETFCSILSWTSESTASLDSMTEHSFEIPTWGCSDKTFQVLYTRCIDGQLTYTPDDRNGVIIPASFAQRLFGTKMAAGKTFTLGEAKGTLIRGVYEDFPSNCSMINAVYYNRGDRGLDDWSEWTSIGYLKLHEKANNKQFLAHFPKEIKRQVYATLLKQNSDGHSLTEDDKKEFDTWFEKFYSSYDFRLRPIRETWFSGVSDKDRGNPAMQWVLQLACVLLLLIGGFNFLNFTLAESPMRVRSTNTRRVLGESVRVLRIKLILESVLVAVVAYVVAMGLCEAIASLHTQLLMSDLSLKKNVNLCLLTLLCALVIGVITAVYPAHFITSFPPALVLKGSFGLTPRGRQLRTTLIWLQLTISLLLVIYIGILSLQSRFIYHSDYGFQKDEVLYANLPDQLMPKKDALRQEALAIPGVQEVSYSNFELGTQDGYMGWGRGDKDHVVSFDCMPVDWRYLRTMGIKIVEGRDFVEHDGDCFIINEAARRTWPWVEMDKPLLENDLTVVGVCEDIRFGSTRTDRTAVPLAFCILGEKYAGWGDRCQVMNIRVGNNTDKVATRHKLQKMLTHMNNDEQVEISFLDDKLEQLYQEEFRFIRLVIIFSLVCLVLTLIGVFCLTMFEAEYRRKEIGLRKVFGSSSGQILSLLSRRYLLLILLAFIVATPLAWWLGTQWLQSFAERTPIYWWLFPLALLFIGLVTLGTIILQGWRAATENPINSIKTE